MSPPKSSPPLPKLQRTGSHYEDPDMRQAAFRANLDCMIESATAVEAEVPWRWTHGKVHRYGAWLPLCGSTSIDTLLRFGVAPVLLLRVQLGAAWMFLAIGLLSVAATVENVHAWLAVDNLQDVNATSNSTGIQGASLDDLSALLSTGFTNGSVVLQMTTLGWRLSSVSPDSARVQNWLGVTQFILVLLFLVWMRRKMRVKSYTADKNFVTASDFTVMVSGLKREENSQFLQGRLADWFTDKYGGEQKTKVIVVMAVECEDVIKLLTRRRAKWLDLKDAEAALRQRGASAPREASLTRAKEELEKVDIKLRKANAKSRCGSGTAFVTFEHAKERNKCLKDFAIPEWVDALELLGLRGCSWAPWAEQYAKRRELTKDFGDVDYDGLPLKKVVEVTAAPEPEDVLWENLEVPRVRSICYTAASMVVVLLLLCVSTIIMVLIKRSVIEVYDEIEVCIAKLEAAAGEKVECTYAAEVASWGSNWMTAVTMLLSSASALALITLNSLIRNIVYVMARYECKHTRTLKEKTVFYKMSFAYLVNSVVLLMFVYYDKAAEWSKPGLVLNQALLLLCSDLALNSILARLSNGSGWWPLQRWIGDRVATSQARLQEYYNPPIPLLGEMYASVVRTCGLCMYYGPMQPLCYWLGAATMLANYLCSKYSMIHYNRVPPRMSDELCEGLRQVLSIILLGHVVISLYFYANSCEGGCKSPVLWPVVLSAVAYLLFVVVPVEYVPGLERFYAQEDDVPDVTYSELLAKQEASHVTYDVPVPKEGAGKITAQGRFLRYDFTPAVLRTPYCLPESGRGGPAEGGAI